MTYKEHFLQNITLAYPVMLSQLGHVVVGVADSIMVGQLGTEELAAVSLGGAPFYVVMLFGIGVSYALTPLVAASDGQNQQSGIRSLLKHAVILDAVFGVLLFLLLYFGGPLLSYFDQEPVVVDLALPYLNIIAGSLIPVMIFQAFRQFAEGLSYTKQAMYISISANVVNIILNYFLIYGIWIFPELGMNGAGWSTLISRVLMVIVMIWFVFRFKDFKPYVTGFNLSNYEWKIWKKLLKIGIPSGLQFVFEVGAFAMAAIMVGWLGAVPLAAHQIALNLSGITYMTASGISAAATIRVGNQLGKNDISTLRRAGFTCTIMAAGFMAICGLVFILGKTLLPSYYVDDVAVIALSADLLIVAAFFQISDGIQVVGLGSLRGLADVKIPTIVTMVAYWFIAIPVGYVLGITLDMGSIGIWIGLLIGLTLAAIAHLWRFQNLTRRLLHR
ncbi:MAG: MATE family efflux transporter [Cyclobacteriaceae bacterium]